MLHLNRQFYETVVIHLRRNWKLYSIVFFIFSINFGYAMVYHISPSVDARVYDAVGWNIASGNGYVSGLQGDPRLDSAIERVGPGYEYFLGSIFFVFGHRLWAVWMIQSLLCALSVALVYFLTKRLFSGYENVERASIIAALLLGISPDVITVNAMLLSETLSIFVFVVFLLLFVRFIQKEESRRMQWGVLGAVIAGCILVRTTFLPILLCPIGYLVWRKRYHSIGYILLGLLLVMTPWTIRNAFVYHTFLPTNAALGSNLIAGNNPDANGEWNGIPSAYSSVGNTITDPLSQNAYYVTAGKEFILSHPLSYLRLTVSRFSIYFSVLRPSAFWFHLSKNGQLITAALSILHTGILFVFGLFGLFLAWIKRKEFGVSFFCISSAAIMACAVSIAIIVETRYRFPIYPIFAIFAGYGIVVFEKRYGRFLIASVALIGINAVVDLFRVMEKIQQRLY